MHEERVYYPFLATQQYTAFYQFVNLDKEWDLRPSGRNMTPICRGAIHGGPFYRLCVGDGILALSGNRWTHYVAGGGDGSRVSYPLTNSPKKARLAAGTSEKKNVLR